MNKILQSIAIVILIFQVPLTWADRPEISNGEKAYAALQVQNLMSRHAYFHAAGMNLEEVDRLWVSADGEYAKTAAFASPAWVMPGIDVIRGAYGLENQNTREEALKKLNEAFPEVKFTKENLGAGHEWAMHTTTTPIIEIAGDGKTAKGVWYSPGMGLMARLKDGDAEVGGVFFWEKYGGDFVKENGEWKIWHLQMAYDFTPGLPEAWREPLAMRKDDASKDAAGDDSVMRQAGERMNELPPGFEKPTYSYPSYSPARPGLIYPRLPEPYYTFSETFSYCNCDDSSYPDSSETLGIVDFSPSASTNPDMTGFVAEVDRNRDGKMSKSEWTAKRLPISSFNMFEKGRGYVTLEDYQKNPAPKGIDLNGDGKLTVVEFREFDKIMAEKMANNR